MAHGTSGPRWRLGTNARVIHALALWLGFLAVAHFARLVLFPHLGMLGGVIGFVLFFGGVLWLGMMRLGRVSAGDLGITLFRWRREVLLGLLGFAGISVVLAIRVAVSDGSGALGDLLEELGAFTWMQHLQFLFIGLLAAAAEDTLYRGYIQPTLMARYGAAIGFSATIAMFAIGHFTGMPPMWRVVVLCITGFGFGILRWRNRPLIASYVAHTVLWVVWGNA